MGPKTNEIIKNQSKNILLVPTALLILFNTHSLEEPSKYSNANNYIKNKSKTTHIDKWIQTKQWNNQKPVKISTHQLLY